MSHRIILDKFHIPSIDDDNDMNHHNKYLKSIKSNSNNDHQHEHEISSKEQEKELEIETTAALTTPVADDAIDSTTNSDNNITSSSSSRSSSANLQQLPMFNHKEDDIPAGGVIIFFHIAKTGGTTIRTYLEALAKKYKSHYSFIRWTVHEYSVLDKEQQQQKQIDIDTASSSSSTSSNICEPTKKGKTRARLLNKNIQNTLTSTEPTKTILLEIHGGEMGLKYLSPYIQKWRQLSTKYSKPLFIFTLVRKPIPFHISFFNFFNVGCNYDWCEQNQYDTNHVQEEDIISSIKPNLQCFFLLNDRHASYYHPCQPSKDDCEDIYSTMKQDLDWIGITENISNETLPLLKHVVGDTTPIIKNNGSSTKHKSPSTKLNEGKGHNLLNVGDRKKGIWKPLKNTTSTQIIEESNYDSWIYDQIKMDYSVADLYPNL